MAGRGRGMEINVPLVLGVWLLGVALERTERGGKASVGMVPFEAGLR